MSSTSTSINERSWNSYEAERAVGRYALVPRVPTSIMLELFSVPHHECSPGL